MQENQNSGRIDTQNLGNVEVKNTASVNPRQPQRQPSNNPNRKPNNGSRPPQHRKKTKKQVAMQRMLIVFGIILAIFLIIFSMGASWGKGRGTKLTKDNITTQLASISDISKTNYHYTNITKFDAVDDFYGFDASDYSNLTISYDGVITAYIDASKIKVEVSGSKVNITLPEASIESNEITENSVAVYNSNNGSFENITLTDFAGFQTTQQPVAQTKATTNGLLFDTSERAKAAIKPLIESLAGARKDKYTITIS